jgi:hypothetical protein
MQSIKPQTIAPAKPLPDKPVNVTVKPAVAIVVPSVVPSASVVKVK